jgi:hypothetical protein
MTQRECQEDVILNFEGVGQFSKDVMPKSRSRHPLRGWRDRDLGGNLFAYPTFLTA